MSALAADLVRIPGKAFPVTDPVTGIPMHMRISTFLVTPTEITQAEYQRVMGSNPSAHKGDNLPVENVTWQDAVRYANERSRAEKLPLCYEPSTFERVAGACGGYRLLTDAEWTYAAGKARPSGANLGPADTKNTRSLTEHLKTGGTRPAGSTQPNEFGLYEMQGNVWEWVEDWNDPQRGIYSTVDPAGPAVGLAKVLRGGSFMSTQSGNWSRGYRSSLEPTRRSPFTGFRVCRSAGDALPDAHFDSAQYNVIPDAMKGQTGGLTLQPADRLRELWTAVIGRTDIEKPKPEARVVSTDKEPGYTGTLMYLRTEADSEEKIYVMLPPRRDPKQRLPVVIVPYYDVDTPAGRPMGGRAYTEGGTRSYGALAVQRGFAAIAIRWFGESYGEHYAEAVANMKTRHPKLTGLGKWVWDSQRLLDWIETRPEFDAKRIGMIGHSLGGKMTLYATAFDARIRVAVSSEPGIGVSFSNYEDFWYLGESLDKQRDQHELLALIAPRPFLLIGGDSSDSDKSWLYINAARAAYTNPERLGYVNHRKGHSPTPESIAAAMDWLEHYL